MSTLELKEFRDIVDADWPGRGAPKPPAAEDVQKALQILMVRQFIYSDDRSLSRYYDIILAHRLFFEKYYGAMGYELIIEPQDQMIGLRPEEGLQRSDSVYARMKKIETLVLICLKLAYEEAIHESNLHEGARVEISSEDLLSKFETITNLDRPEETHLKEMLGDFKRRGFVRLGDYDPDERVLPITIMPGVDHVVSEVYMKQLRDADFTGTDPGGAGEDRIEAEIASNNDGEEGEEDA